MASLNAKVLKRVDTVKIGAVGTAIGSCTDIGSCRMAKIAISVDENVATDASAADAVSDVAFSNLRGTLTLTLEDITKENVAAALGGELVLNGSGVATGAVLVSGGIEPAYKTVYVTGSYMDGVAVTWRAYKAYIKPGAEIQLNNEQQLLEVEYTLMVDSSGNMFTASPS